MFKAKAFGISIISAFMVFSSGSAAVFAEETVEKEPIVIEEKEEVIPTQEASDLDEYDVEFAGEVTDAGEYVSSMTIDFGEKKISGLTNETFEVKMTSTVDYGEAKGKPYAYYNADNPLPIVKTEISGSAAKVYFDLSAAPVLTWLAEGRNYPAVLSFTIEQKKPLIETGADGKEQEYNAVYKSDAASWKDLKNDELAKFEDVQDEINYQFHKGTNDKLIVFFHGNGEGDFPVKDTNNNIAQILANRGGAAWVSEAQEVFGDAYVMAFQAPNMWYFAIKDDLLTPVYNEIQKVIQDNGINPDEVYLSGASAGGFMSTRMIIKYPDLFKAAMINCPALDAANARTDTDNSIPTDEELASIRESKTAIWLVQGETDSSVDPDECSKRIWNIITDDKAVTEKKYEGTLGIASGFTTYETVDGKYKLSLYETFDLDDVEGISGETRKGGKLKFAEDYDQDGVYTEVKYSDHWSWIYTLRNNPEAADGTHIWQWAVNYEEPKTIKGSQKVVVTGDDWGPSVEKTIITLEEAVKAADLDPAKFAVKEKKEAFDWAVFQPTTSKVSRKVLDVYLSDENGEKVNAAEGKIVTVEMYISPNDGSPFYYDFFTGFNRWVDQYRLIAEANIFSGEEPVVITAASDIDFYDNDQWISPVADEFKQDTFNATDGTPIVYGEWAPEKDDKKNALIIWLHGAGEGTNKGKNDNYIDLLGNKVTAFAGEEFQSLFGGAYIVTPQAPTMWMDDGTGEYQNGDKGSVYEPALFEFIENYVKNNSDVDPDRIIIGGCSNGGYMTMEMIIKHPDYFHKAYPICEAFYTEFITDDQIKALADGGTGIWFTFADTDTTVNPTLTSLPAYSKLKKAGAEVHITEWADVRDTSGRFTDAEGNPYEYNGHWSWIYFDNNDNFCDDEGLNEWEWLADLSSVKANRLYGSTRYETSIKNADELKSLLGVSQFDNVILASGTNFADALSGSYLAYVKNAPVLITPPVPLSENTQNKEINEYIAANLKEGGTVYVLGGEAAVPNHRLEGLEGFTIKRLAGATRYETNIEILKEAKVSNEDILVSTGYNYADSLSASAVKRPILLVGEKLSEAQAQYLKGLKNNKYYILGGDKAVNKEIEKELEAFGKTKRISGATRHETSAALAEEFCKDAKLAVLAYSYNFPDGLCGGPLAAALNAPIILTRTNDEAAALDYCKKAGIGRGYIFGGPILISDDSAVKIFALESADQIAEIK